MQIFYHNTRKGLKEIAEKYRSLSFIFLHDTGYMYGIGCKADDREAVEKIKKLKERSGNKGFIMLLPDISALTLTDGRSHTRASCKKFKTLKVRVDPKAFFLVEQYQPGNVTFVLPLIDGKEYAPFRIKGKIAFRVPENEELRTFIRYLEKPVFSTSINRSGEKPLNDLESILRLPWFDFALLPASGSEHVQATRTETAEGKPSTVIELAADELICHREGSVQLREIEESYRKPLILFVCTGNICRSPLAEYYTRHIIEERGLPYRTASAGFITESVAISANSFSVLNDEGISAEEHYSQVIRKDLLQRSWLILTMEQEHRLMLNRNYPFCKKRVYTLSGFSGFRGDVADPFQQSMERYIDTYQLIKKYVSVLIDKLTLRTDKLLTLKQLARIKPEDIGE